MYQTKLLMSCLASAALACSAVAADAKTKPAAKPETKPAVKPAVKPAAPKAYPFTAFPAVVAEINGKKITRADVAAFLQQSGQLPPAVTAEQIKPAVYQIVQACVYENLLNAAMAKAKFNLTDAQIKARIMAELNQMPKEQRAMMTQMLAMRNSTMEKHVEKLVSTPQARKNFLIQAFIDTVIKKDKVSAAAAKKYYDAHLADYTAPADGKDAIRASHILIALKKDDKGKLSDGKAELAKANQLLARLKKNPKDFELLAAENSACPSGKQNGGSLGAFRKGMMVPEFEAAALKLKPGELSAPVKTQFGYHIIRRDALRAAQVQPFAAVKEQIIAELESEAFSKAVRAYLTSLEKAAKVKILVSKPAMPMMMQ